MAANEPVAGAPAPVVLEGVEPVAGAPAPVVEGVEP